MIGESAVFPAVFSGRFSAAAAVGVRPLGEVKKKKGVSNQKAFYTWHCRSAGSLSGWHKRGLGLFMSARVYDRAVLCLPRPIVGDSLYRHATRCDSVKIA